MGMDFVSYSCLRCSTTGLGVGGGPEYRLQLGNLDQGLNESLELFHLGRASNSTVLSLEHERMLWEQSGVERKICHGVLVW